MRTYGATSAPLIVKNKVLVGTSGGDDGVCGFVAAYDAQTGKEAWRFWTIPAAPLGGLLWLGAPLSERRQPSQQREESECPLKPVQFHRFKCLPRTQLGFPDKPYHVSTSDNSGQSHRSITKRCSLPPRRRWIHENLAQRPAIHPVRIHQMH